jgi:hypothetical protein
MQYKHPEVRKGGVRYASLGNKVLRKMTRHPTVRTAGMRRGGGYDALRRTYVVFWVSMIVTAALLTFVTLYVRPRALPIPEMQAVELPVAKIQLTANRAGLCRHLLFHNDTGRFEDDGTGRCRGLIAEELLVNSIRTNRADALARVFKIR